MSQAQYPRRPKYFAHRYTRLMTKTCAVNDIGATAAWLCVTIAMLEDSKRYSGPVTFWNHQLMPLIGVSKWEALNNARSKAVEAGWLHYDPGGRRQVGRYWVTIPPQFADLEDSPCDESSYPANGDLGSSSYPAKGGLGGDLDGDLHGDLGGDPSYLSPNPNPNSSVATDDREDDRENDSHPNGKPRTPQEFFDRFQDFARKNDLAVPRRLTADRRKKIASRLRSETWWTEFKAGLDRVPVPNNERFTWQPDLDWFVANESNVVKLAEGKYEHGGNGQEKEPKFDN